MGSTKLTGRVRRAVDLAQRLAPESNADTGHLLLALTQAGGAGELALARVGLDAGTVRMHLDEMPADGAERRAGRFDPEALALIGIDLEQVRTAVGGQFGPGALDQAAAGTPVTGAFTRALRIAENRRLSYGHPFVGTEHLVIALAETPGTVARDIMNSAGVSAADVVAAVNEAIGSHRAPAR